MQYTEQIKQLREQIPVGLKAAEKYLTTTNGSVEEATLLFHMDMKKLFISKMNATEEEAEKFLISHQYDLGKAMDKYEREKFNHVEYVIRHTKDKKDTLYGIIAYIDYTLETNKSLADCPENYSVYRTFSVIKSWMDYYGWEGDLIRDNERDMEVIHIFFFI